jgi:hypothetical protein
MPMSASTVSTVEQQERLPGEEPSCAACPHPAVAHDAVGQRYCRATANAGTVRGCICQPG